MAKRKIEIFTSACPLCVETLKLVDELVCPNCEVIEHNIKEQCESKICLQKAKEYGVKSTPTVVIDGKIVSCGKPTREELVAAGVGQA